MSPEYIERSFVCWHTAWMWSYRPHNLAATTWRLLLACVVPLCFSISAVFQHPFQ